MNYGWYLPSWIDIISVGIFLMFSSERVHLNVFEVDSTETKGREDCSRLCLKTLTEYFYFLSLLNI